MKAIVDKKNYRITLDNEAVKAIRFCYGVNTDLRRSLVGLPLEPLKRWIENHKIQLFGQVIFDMDAASNDYEDMMDDVVRQILR